MEEKDVPMDVDRPFSNKKGRYSGIFIPRISYGQRRAQEEDAPERIRFEAPVPPPEIGGPRYADGPELEEVPAVDYADVKNAELEQQALQQVMEDPMLADELKELDHHINIIRQNNLERRAERIREQNYIAARRAHIRAMRAPIIAQQQAVKQSTTKPFDWKKKYIGFAKAVAKEKLINLNRSAAIESYKNANKKQYPKYKYKFKRKFSRFSRFRRPYKRRRY